MSLFVRRYVVLGCFFVLNGLGLWQGLRLWEAYLADRSGGDPVLRLSPADLDQVSGREGLSWEWDRPVVAPEMVGEVLTSSPVDMNPALLGEFQWTSEQRLDFVPLVDWPVARRMAIDLQLLTTNAHQQVFALQHQSQVLGPPLEVLTAEPLLDAYQHTMEIRLRFNADVDPDVLKRHVQLWDQQGDGIQFEVKETPHRDEFLLASHWSGTGALSLVVQKGLTSIYGDGAALSHDRTYKIKEIDQFALTGFDVRQPTFGSAEIELSFTERPSLQSISEGLTIEPPVQVSVGHGKWWRRQSCLISGDFKPGTRYRISLSAGTSSLSGHGLKEDLSRELMIPHREPGLKFAHQGWILNAQGAAKVEVFTENEGALQVQLYRVHENNLVDYALRASGQDSWQSTRHPEKLLGRQVYDQRLADVASGSTFLELSDVLKVSGQGVYRLRVEGRNSGERIERLIALSDTGLLARKTGEGLLVWALQLDSAHAVADMEVSLWSDTRQLLAEGKTNADGLLSLAWVDDAERGSPKVLLGHKQDAFALLTLGDAQPFPGDNGERAYLDDGNEAFVYTARGMYRPEETVNARAIVRGAGCRLPGVFPVEWRLVNAAGLTVWKSQQTLSDLGTTQVSIDLKPEWPNGSYDLRLSLPGKDAEVWGQTRFHLESFVPPQVVVTAESPDGEVAVSDRFEVKLHARMLYGGPASHHKGKAVLTLVPEVFRSSEYPTYVFSDVRKKGFASWTRPLRKFETDAAGQVAFRVDVPANKVGPSTVRAVVGLSVTEFSGREASTFFSRRIDRVPYYLGMQAGAGSAETIEVNLLSVDPSGAEVAEHPDVEIAWYRVHHQYGYRRDAKGRYTWFSDEVDVLEGQRNEPLAAGRLGFQLPVVAAGTYRIVAKDMQTGFTCSQKVSVGFHAQAPERADRVVMQLNQETSQPGDQVEVQVSAPFAGRLLLTMEGAQGLGSQVIQMTEKTAVVSLTVPETDLANLWLRASVVRPQPGNGAAPVMRAEGAIPLRLTPKVSQQPLHIEVASQLKPSQSVTLQLSGTPGAEVVVAGVDEGILLLSNFETPKPWPWFMALRRAVSMQWDSFDDVMPEIGAGFFAGESQMGGGMGSALRKRLNPVDAKRFKPLSWWSGVQRIPESGVLDLQMPMPEFSGQIRWMAVQVSAESMGHAEASSRVGREIIVQQSLPLFLSPGDETLWRVRLHNRSEQAQTVSLMPSVKGPVGFEGDGQVLTLKAGEVAQREWRVQATPAMGKAEVTLGVKAGGDFWQDTLELAVRPIEAFEARMDRYILNPGQSLSIGDGAEMLAGTSERWLRVVSMPVLELAASRGYLLRYPYGCLEQTVSAASPALYMSAWSADAEEGAQAILEAGLVALWKKQRRDGSFGYWTDRDKVSVAGSFGALFFMLQAKAQGVDVDARQLQLAEDWARGWLLSATWVAEDGEANLNIALACRVLALAGELDVGWLQRLRERREDLGSYGRVMAAEAMLYSGRRALALEMLQGISRVDRGWGWHSATSGDAALLWVLLKLDPQDGRIYALMERVLGQRNQQGRWAHTYENAAVIRAFVAYANVWPPATGDFQVGIGRKGRAFDHLQEGAEVLLMEKGDTGVLMNQGTRPVYVSIRQEGVPLKASVVENTFEVDRELLHLDGRRVGAGERVKSGEMLMLRFRVSRMPHQVAHLVLDQALPAGLEPLPFSQQQKPWERMHQKVNEGVTPLRHLELRDDRLLLFPNKVSAQPQVYYVLVRAVSPGRYTFPALFGQDMYDDQVIFRGPVTSLEVMP